MGIWQRLAVRKEVPQICGLIIFRFAELPQMWQFADSLFADHIFYAICDLRTQLFFVDLKLQKIRKYLIFLLTNISSHSK
jgi:hypothetical protein